MPLRLTANDRSLSGHDYDDIVGVRYEFPPRYRNRVQRGERFVYYRGRRRLDGRVQPQVYLGTGIVGDVHSSERHTDRLVCEVEDWQPFDKPLPFRDAEGRYYEPGAEGGGIYWQVGVRAIDEVIYERIIGDANRDPNTDAAETSTAETSSAGGGTYASPQAASVVDVYAMDVAMTEAACRWPGSDIERQHQNNPGFDLRVGPAAGVVRYVEVKGTQMAYPRFFMSEGQRAFSEHAADRYTLVVIYDINLNERSHKVFWHDGSVTNDAFLMASRQWVCEIRRST